VYGGRGVSAQQKPLELIHARNLLTCVSTPAFLVDSAGDIVFFNEAAGTVLGRRFEETGSIGHEQWRRLIGPFDERGEPIPFEQLALNLALRRGQAGHLRHKIREAGGTLREIEVSAVPLVATGGGFRGAIVFLWPAGEIDVGNAGIGAAAASESEGAAL
jgi:PAS domain-containing protein